MYQGFDVNLDARFRNGAFLKARHRRDGAHVRQLQPRWRPASTRSRDRRRRRARRPTRTARRAATANIRYRPDFKASGSYTLPWDVQLGRHLPVQPRHPERRRGSEHPGELDDHPGGFAPGGAQRHAVSRPSAARWTPRRRARPFSLMREGLDYGKYNLNQLDMKLSKRFRSTRYRLRVDFDLYNVFNSSWPYTVTTTYSTATTATGSGRPTCCRTASSSLARVSTSRRV